GPAVARVQGYRRLVSPRHLQRSAAVPLVPVGADDGEDLAVADGAQHRGGVGAGVDDDYLVVVADDPAVNTGAGLYRLDPCVLSAHQSAGLPAPAGNCAQR